MKIQKSRKFVSPFVAAMIAALISAPLAFAEDPAPLAPPPSADVPAETTTPSETAPVAPMDNGSMGMGSPEAEQAPVEHHAKKSKKKKKEKKKKKNSKKNSKHSKKKKKKKHHAA